MKGPIANPEALEHLEAGERRSPPKSHMPSHPVPASVSHRNHRERGRTEFSCWCNAVLLGMPLVGHVAGYSIEIEVGDGIPAAAQGSVLQRWGHCSGRAREGSVCCPWALVWRGVQRHESPLEDAHSRLSLCLPDCGQEQPLQVH